MAVFMSTGGGDIYAGETREAVVQAALQDNRRLLPTELAEVSGSLLMNHEEHGQLTLEECYQLNGNTDTPYCIATDSL